MSQIKKKWIGNDQIGALKVLLEKNAALRGTLQNGDIAELMKLTEEDQLLLFGRPVVEVGGEKEILATIKDIQDALEGADFDAYLKRDGSVAMEGSINFALAEPTPSEQLYKFYDTTIFNGAYGKAVSSIKLVVSGEVNGEEVVLGSPAGPEGVYQYLASSLRDALYGLINTPLQALGYVVSTDADTVYVTNPAGEAVDLTVELFDQDDMAFDLQIYKMFEPTVQETGSTGGGALHKITNLANGTDANDAVNKSQLDAAISQEVADRNQAISDAIGEIPEVDLTPYLKKDGSVEVEGNLVFKTVVGEDELPAYLNIKNIADAVDSRDAVNKQQLDSSISSAVAPLMKIDGSTAMTGDLDMDSHQVKNVASATDGSDAVNLSQVQAMIGQLESSIGPLKPEVLIVTSDVNWLNAADNTVLSTLLPFSDDEGTTIDIADIHVGARIAVQAGTNSRILKVVEVEGVKQVVADELPLAQGDSFFVRWELLDTPAEKETAALYQYNGEDLIKLADLDWAFATGINISDSYTKATTATPVLAGDSVQTAIGKLEKQINELEANVGDDLNGYLAVDGSNEMKGDITFETEGQDLVHQIKNLAPATDNSDAVNFAQLRSQGRAVQLYATSVNQVETLTAASARTFFIGSEEESYNLIIKMPSIDDLMVGESFRFTSWAEQETEIQDSSGETLIKIGAGQTIQIFVTDDGGVKSFDGIYTPMIDDEFGFMNFGGIRLVGIAPAENGNEAVSLAQLTEALSNLVEEMKVEFEKVEVELTSTDIANGYIDLEHKVMAKSMHIIIDRVALVEGTDYELATVDGVTRVVFLAPLVIPSETALVATDVLHINYAFKPSEQVE